MPHDFYDLTRALEVMRTFELAGFTVEVRSRHHPLSDRNASHPHKRDWAIILPEVEFGSHNNSFKRIDWLCEKLGIEWRQERSDKGVHLGLNREDWIKEYDAIERVGSYKGWCPECPEPSERDRNSSYKQQDLRGDSLLCFHHYGEMMLHNEFPECP